MATSTMMTIILIELNPYPAACHRSVCPELKRSHETAFGPSHSFSIQTKIHEEYSFPPDNFQGDTLLRNNDYEQTIGGIVNSRIVGVAIQLTS
jgi:hypothetical protein